MSRIKKKWEIDTCVCWLLIFDKNQVGRLSQKKVKFKPIDYQYKCQSNILAYQFFLGKNHQLSIRVDSQIFQ